MATASLLGGGLGGRLGSGRIMLAAELLMIGGIVSSAWIVSWIASMSPLFMIFLSCSASPDRSRNVSGSATKACTSAGSLLSSIRKSESFSAIASHPFLDPRLNLRVVLRPIQLLAVVCWFEKVL